MNDATVHSRKSFLVNVAPGDDRATRHVAAAQCFCERDDVRFQVPMLKAEHFSSAAKSSLNFIRDEERSVFPAKLLRARKEICFRSLAAFALNGLDHECSDIFGSQLSI